ncbi:hypothetical protein GCM10010326_14790 [Streptomyces xanthochromogenes]|uniref:Uncharacterized protein n=1 Tax=Streptomyces xanthochromogenes TaxID=67384 RepID=A0ABQ2ZTW6_9ACTN|nr:hypothetical protein GCM10010326_14790 [Streptomyces xanthochromogenes]
MTVESSSLNTIPYWRRMSATDLASGSRGHRTSGGSLSVQKSGSLDGTLSAAGRYASVETGDATIPFRHRNRHGQAEAERCLFGVGAHDGPKARLGFRATPLRLGIAREPAHLLRARRTVPGDVGRVREEEEEPQGPHAPLARGGQRVTPTRNRHVPALAPQLDPAIRTGTQTTRPARQITLW